MGEFTLHKVTEIKLGKIESSENTVWRSILFEAEGEEEPFTITLFGTRENLEVKL